MSEKMKSPDIRALLNYAFSALFRGFDVLIPSCNKKTQSLITTAIF
jgi:hypothetical protein